MVWTDKQRAILDGALRVFARDGYTRAGIDAIAKEAGVSTRTIYNNFRDKAALFEIVIAESADRVAEWHIALIDAHLRKVTDLEEDLTALGLDLVRHAVEENAVHFALVRHIHADADHIPRAVVEAWHEAGPLRVRRHLAGRLAELPGLRLADPGAAARHFTVLLSPDTVAAPPVADEPYVRDAVRVFLYGYAA